MGHLSSAPRTNDAPASDWPRRTNRLLAMVSTGRGDHSLVSWRRRSHPSFRARLPTQPEAQPRRVDRGLLGCIDYGVAQAKRASGQDLVIVIGNTGAGKSTFVNLLEGCELEMLTKLEAGLVQDDDDEAESEVRRTHAKGSKVKELSPYLSLSLSLSHVHPSVSLPLRLSCYARRLPGLPRQPRLRDQRRERREHQGDAGRVGERACRRVDQLPGS